MQKAQDIFSFLLKTGLKMFHFIFLVSYTWKCNLGLLTQIKSLIFEKKKKKKEKEHISQVKKNKDFINIYRIISNKRSPSNKRPPNLFSNKTR